MSPTSQGHLLQVVNVKDVLGFLFAGLVSAAVVAPFRRLPFWVAMLAGVVPLLLFLLMAAAISIYQNFV